MIFGSKILVIDHYNKFRNAAEFPAETNIPKCLEYRYKLK
jgi:hypothetical protein